MDINVTQVKPRNLSVITNKRSPRVVNVPPLHRKKQLSFWHVLNVFCLHTKNDLEKHHNFTWNLLDVKLMMVLNVSGLNLGCHFNVKRCRVSHRYIFRGFIFVNEYHKKFECIFILIIIIIKICSAHISTLLGAQGAETKKKQFTVIAKTKLCTEIHVQCNYKYTSSLKNCDIRWVLSSDLNLVILWQDLSLVGRWFQTVILSCNLHRLIFLKCRSTVGWFKESKVIFKSSFANKSWRYSSYSSD